MFKKLMKSNILLFKLILIISLIISSYGFAEAQGIGNSVTFPSSDDTDGLYYAQTEDGVNIVLKRYRPFHTDNFNVGKTPIVLFNGITTCMKMWDIRTTADTEQLYASFKLDKNKIAEWAIDDPYVQKDPMLYYSMAYYLYKFGYDVWLTNFRGTGVGNQRSELNKGGISLDEWIVYDTAAAIDKVIEITNKKPIIGGHSTGGLVGYGYLQGVYFDKTTGHVKNSTELAKERNNKIAAYMPLDPAGIPPLPPFLNLTPAWMLMGSPLFIPLGNVLNTLVNVPGINYLITPNSPVIATAQNSIVTIFDLDQFTQGETLLQYTSFMNTKNINKYLMDYLLRHIETGFPIRGYGQFYDFGMNNTIREFWKNGEENKNKIQGPKPQENDGYYYYIDRMNLITVPTLTILSETQSAVSPDYSIRDIVLSKAHHVMDETHIIPNSGHIDEYLGDVPPNSIYYIWRDWLNRMQEFGYLD